MSRRHTDHHAALGMGRYVWGVGGGIILEEEKLPVEWALVATGLISKTKGGGGLEGARAGPASLIKLITCPPMAPMNQSKTVLLTTPPPFTIHGTVQAVRCVRVAQCAPSYEPVALASITTLQEQEPLWCTAVQDHRH